MQALIILGNEVYVMHLDFVRKFSLKIWSIVFGAQKINGSKLKTFEMVIFFFSRKQRQKILVFWGDLFISWSLYRCCSENALSYFKQRQNQLSWLRTTIEILHYCKRLANYQISKANLKKSLQLLFLIQKVKLL